MSYSRQQQPKIPVQLLIGLVIALFAIGQYFMNTQVNPVTGEKQRVAMTPKQEIALGLQSAPEMARQMGGEVSPREPLTKLVKAVGDRLISHSHAAKSPYRFDFHLLADNEMINAFALPGGQVFITLGLLKRLDNEAQLAGVLGHEIGHVVNRHAAEHMARGQFGQTLVQAAAVAGSGDNNSAQNSQMVAQMVNQMIQLKYGRGDETEADTYGLSYMAEAGYDPSQMLGVMQVLLEAAKGARQPEFLASHPHPESRIAHIEEVLHKTYPDGVPDKLTKGQPIRTRSRGEQ